MEKEKENIHSMVVVVPWSFGCTGECVCCREGEMAEGSERVCVSVCLGERREKKRKGDESGR